LFLLFGLSVAEGFFMQGGFAVEETVEAWLLLRLWVLWATGSVSVVGVMTGDVVAVLLLEKEDGVVVLDAGVSCFVTCRAEGGRVAVPMGWSIVSVVVVIAAGAGAGATTYT
jgi:hypothetical protein